MTKALMKVLASDPRRDEDDARRSGVDAVDVERDGVLGLRALTIRERANGGEFQLFDSQYVIRTNRMYESNAIEAVIYVSSRPRRSRRVLRQRRQ